MELQKRQVMTAFENMKVDLSLERQPALAG